MKEITIKVHSENEKSFLGKVKELNALFTKKNLPLIYVEETCRYLISTLRDIYGDVFRKDYLITYKVFSLFAQKNLSGEQVDFEGVVNFMSLGKEDTRILSISNPIINRIMQTEHCVCDKCKKDIVRGKYFIFSKNKEIQNRNDFYILGSTCAKDYFPFNIESYLTSYKSCLNQLREYDEDYGGLSYRNNNCSIKDVVYATGLVTNGFTSTYDKTSTLNDIENLLNATDSKLRNYWEDRLSNNFDIEESLAIARNYFQDKVGDFNFNCNQVLRGETLNKKWIRRTACAIYFGNKNGRKELERKESSKLSNYVGSVGEKFKDWDLTFDSTFSFNTRFGFTNVLKFKDDNGNIFVWYTQKSSNDLINKKLESGDKLKISGTIKDHTEYKEEKQTLITRCKVK